MVLATGKHHGHPGPVVKRWHCPRDWGHPRTRDMLTPHRVWGPCCVQPLPTSGCGAAAGLWCSCGDRAVPPQRDSDGTGRRLHQDTIGGR